MRARTGTWTFLAFALSLTLASSPRSLTAQEPTPPNRTDTLRILVYNTHHGEGTDGILDLERIGRLINQVAPDLVALQEIDRLVERTGFVDQPAEYGSLTGMVHVFGQFMPYQGGQYGMALLSSLPVLAWTNHTLPPGQEPRSALTARVQLPGTGRELIFAGIHFYRTEEERLAQADSLMSILRDEAVPAILAGDFNSEPESPVMARLGTEWSILPKKGLPFTYPSQDPAREIDFVLFKPKTGFQLLEHRVLKETMASDHRPIFLVLEIL